MYTAEDADRGYKGEDSGTYVNNSVLKSRLVQKQTKTKMILKTITMLIYQPISILHLWVPKQQVLPFVVHTLWL